MDPDTKHEATRQHWWGQYQFDLGQTGRWKVGASLLAITRLETEWQIQHKEAQIPEEERNGWSVELPANPLGDEVPVQRHLIRNTSSKLSLKPALADRPVVSRPATPVHISPGARVTIFVGSPLWIVVSTLGSDTVLFDAPNQRPSDTWFGPSTWEGELCYAVRTRAHLALRDIQLRPYRAMTSVDIHNKGKETILVERLKLPVRQLTLYSDGAGMLWTSDVRVVTEEKMASAELRIDDAAPRQADGAKPVAGPRDHIEIHTVQRALNAIFS